MFKNVEKLKIFGILILKYLNDTFLKIKDLIQNSFEKDVASIILGITLGYTDEIDEEIINNFSDSNISHILAVSGMHVGYLILFCKVIFEATVGKRKSNIFSIVILIFYMFLTGMSPSVVRASFMAILMIISKLIYRRSDVWKNICLSLMILLVYNPFVILNTGLILSYIGTIGIIICSKIFRTKEQEIPKFNFKNALKWSMYKILELFKITLFVLIFILPIIATLFNKIPILSLFVSAFIGILIAPIIILFFLLILNKIVGNFQLIITSSMQNFLELLLSSMVKILTNVADSGAKMPLGKYLIITPNIIAVVMYYLIIFVVLFIISQKHRKTVFSKRINNLINLLIFRFNQNKQKII